MVKAQKYDSLEALRGVAALIVFIGHLYTKVEGLPQMNFLSFALNWGTEAVIIFFILSGVVIHLSQEKRPKAFLEFCANRLVRIYPLYLLAVTLAVGVLVFRGQKASGFEIIGNLLFLQTLQGFIVTVLPTNEALWSLSSEISFYFLFAMCLLNRRFAWVWGSLAVLSIILYTAFLPIGWLTHLRLQFAYSCIWLLGYLVAMFRHRFRFERAFAISLIPLALICARINFLDNFYDIYRLIGFGLFCLPLFNILTSRAERVVKVPWWITTGCLIIILTLFWTLSKSLYFTKVSLSSLGVISILLAYTKPRVYDALWKILAKTKGVFVYIGSISYALYIIHMPILYFIQKVFSGHPLIVVFVTILIVLVISHVLELILQPKLALCSKKIFRLKVAA